MAQKILKSILSSRVFLTKLKQRDIVFHLLQKNQFFLLVANCRCASLLASLFGGRLYVSREIDVFHLLQKNSQFFFFQPVELQDNVWKLRTQCLQTLFSGGLQGYRVCGFMYPHIMANAKIVVTYHFLFLQNLILIQQL